MLLEFKIGDQQEFVIVVDETPHLDQTPLPGSYSPAVMSNPFLPPRQLYYDGKIQTATSGQTFRSIDPSTASPLADIHTASNADVDSAIASAQKAFPSWSATPPIARSRLLLKAVQLLRERNDEIAKVETQDTGKPFSETSTVDVVTGADVLEYYANLVGGGGLNGETTQLREDAWVYTKKEALGVCAGIGAWNYPLQMYAAMFDTSHMNCLCCGFLQSSLEVRTMSCRRQYDGLQT